MKYVALILAGASSAIFLKGYLFAKELAANHQPWEFEGGRGFALNAPLWGYGIGGWIIGFIALIVWIATISLMKMKALKSPAIMVAATLLIPFAKSSWILLTMIVDTYWER